MNHPFSHRTGYGLPRDVHQIVAIEQTCVPHPFGDDAIRRLLRHRAVTCLVSTVCSGNYDHISAYVIYEVFRRQRRLLSFAVLPQWRREGIGTSLIREIFASPMAPRLIECELRETNLPAQLFLKACGFRALCVRRGAWKDPGEDSYVFECRKMENTPKPVANGNLLPAFLRRATK